MKDSSPALLGLGARERARYATLLRSAGATITVAQAAEIWQLPAHKTAMALSVLAKKGWLKRIHYGVYIPVPVEQRSLNFLPEEPFAIAEGLFAPCYITGRNAANYWGMTDQIFRTVTVMTAKQVKNRTPTISGVEYDIHTIKSEYFFGLRTLWVGATKVQIADPSRTLIDMMMFPQFCGGTTFIVEVLEDYLRSKHKNIAVLLDYLKQAENGAAVKRLGFLVEKFFKQEEEILAYCAQHLTQGYVKLMPQRECQKLVSRWRVWVPNRWKESS